MEQKLSREAALELADKLLNIEKNHNKVSGNALEIASILTNPNCITGDAKTEFSFAHELLPTKREYSTRLSDTENFLLSRLHGYTGYLY